jgi:hypothetical protein
MNGKDYQRGQRQAWSTILSTATQQLGMTGRTVASLLDEREDAIAALRSLCEDFGDNDWEPTLHLADIIEKYLARPLHAKYPQESSS